EEVIYPTVRGMAAEGNPYTGFLYAGLMVMADGAPKVIEYNCRFGDPETQPIMLRLQSDLAALCEAALDKKLDTVTAQWDPRAALGVVLAAGGYPGDYRKGDVIHGLPQSEGDTVEVFHAGTQLDGADARTSNVVTSGGRVLCVTALGNTVAQAQQLAYAQADKIHWEGGFCPSDNG